jgi:hypothetical protein
MGCLGDEGLKVLDGVGAEVRNVLQRREDHGLGERGIDSGERRSDAVRSEVAEASSCSVREMSDAE